MLQERLPDAADAWRRARTLDPTLPLAPRLAAVCAAVAARLLRAVSKLSQIGDLPLSPSGASDEPPTLVPHEEDLTQAPARLTANTVEPPTATTMPRIGLSAGVSATTRPSAAPFGIRIVPVFASAEIPAAFSADAVP